jgi:hypothetical protein
MEERVKGILKNSLQIDIGLQKKNTPANPGNSISQVERLQTTAARNQSEDRRSCNCGCSAVCCEMMIGARSPSAIIRKSFPLNTCHAISSCRHIFTAFVVFCVSVRVFSSKVHPYCKMAKHNQPRPEEKCFHKHK